MRELQRMQMAENYYVEKDGEEDDDEASEDFYRLLCSDIGRQDINKLKQRKFYRKEW